MPDVLYEEELRAHHGELQGYGLRILELGPEGIAEADRLRETYPKPGTNDLLALALARQERCPLLSGDRDLRDAAVAEGVPVNGTLWLMERMYTAGLVDRPGVAAAYARMREKGRRLPWDEVEQQLEQFK